jgi:hypothetical protein
LVIEKLCDLEILEWEYSRFNKLKGLSLRDRFFGGIGSE